MLPHIGKAAPRNDSPPSAWGAGPPGTAGSSLDGTFGRLSRTGTAGAAVAAPGDAGERLDALARLEGHSVVTKADTARSHAEDLRHRDRFALRSRGGAPACCPMCKRLKPGLFAEAGVQVNPSTARRSVQCGSNADEEVYGQSPSGHLQRTNRAVSPSEAAQPLVTSADGGVPTPAADGTMPVQTANAQRQAASVREASVTDGRTTRAANLAHNRRPELTISREFEAAPDFSTPHWALKATAEASTKLLRLVEDAKALTAAVGAGSGSVPGARAAVELRKAATHLVESHAEEQRAIQEAMLEYASDWQHHSLELLAEQRDKFSAHYERVMEENQSLADQKARLTGLMAPRSGIAPEMVRDFVNEAVATRESLRKNNCRTTSTQWPELTDIRWGGESAMGAHALRTSTSMSASPSANVFSAIDSTVHEQIGTTVPHGNQSPVPFAHKPDPASRAGRLSRVDADEAHRRALLPGGAEFRLDGGPTHEGGRSSPTPIASSRLSAHSGAGDGGFPAPASDAELRQALVELLEDRATATALLRRTDQPTKLLPTTAARRLGVEGTSTTTAEGFQKDRLDRAAVLRVVAAAQPHARVHDPRDTAVMRPGQKLEPPTLPKVKVPTLAKQRMYRTTYPSSPRFSDEQLLAMARTRHGGTMAAVTTPRGGAPSRNLHRR